jgi:vacuolar-type H+-ATPase subunit E/Vma4
MCYFSEASNQTNKARLKLLQAREQHLDQAFEEARGRLKEVTKDKFKYEGILKDLVLQVRGSRTHVSLLVSGSLL